MARVNSRWLAPVAVVMLLLLAGGLVWRGDNANAPPPAAPVAETGPAPAVADRAPAATVPVEPPGVRTWSPLADELNAPHHDVEDDLIIVRDLFSEYHLLFRTFPTGTNAEMTAALTGANSRGMTIVPPDSPHVNTAGELVDRWGTPFFFHSISRRELEVRSAGPDREMWTEDDVQVN